MTDSEVVAMFVVGGSESMSEALARVIDEYPRADVAFMIHAGTAVAWISDDAVLGAFELNIRDLGNFAITDELTVDMVPGWSDATRIHVGAIFKVWCLRSR